MFPFLRPTIAEIDLDSLAHNYHQIRSRVHHGIMILAVLKDNAYGHGTVIIARELKRLGVDLIGVAFADEEVELREGGIKKPILVLSGIYEEEIDNVTEYDLIPMVLMGRQGGDEITAEEIAEKIGTISSEVLYMVEKRVPRGYMRDGKPFEAEVYVRREMGQRGC